MMFLVKSGDEYKRVSRIREHLSEVLDNAVDGIPVGNFWASSENYPRRYVLEIDNVLYTLRKETALNESLIRRHSERGVIIEGKINEMKYRGRVVCV